MLKLKIRYYLDPSHSCTKVKKKKREQERKKKGKRKKEKNKKIKADQKPSDYSPVIQASLEESLANISKYSKRSNVLESRHVDRLSNFCFFF